MLEYAKIELVPPREYSVERQVCVIESIVPRTLPGINPPNAAMHAANATDDTSLVAVEKTMNNTTVKYVCWKIRVHIMFNIVVGMTNEK